MTTLQFPTYPFRIRNNGGQSEIWDALRKKWLVLTPEEWVRQHAVQYLIQQKGYSSGLIHLEKGLKVNGLTKRADIVCYNRKMEPQLLVECKAPEIKLSQATFDQAARYNMTLRVPLLMITNGLETHCAEIDFAASSYRFLPEVPTFLSDHKS